MGGCSIRQYYWRQLITAAGWEPASVNSYQAGPIWNREQCLDGLQFIGGGVWWHWYVGTLRHQCLVTNVLTVDEPPA